MKLKIMLTLVLLFSCSIFLATAQDSTLTERNQAEIQNAKESSIRHFLVSGYGFAGFEKEGDENTTFGPSGFSPIFIWKKSDKLFFETELEFSLEGDELEIALEYATIHYKLAKNLTVSAGKFLTPFGIFGERLHPTWINKLAEKPLGFNHDEGVLAGPMTELGFEFRGGAQLGNTKINYSAYVSNGPALMDGEANPMMAGRLHYANLEDNNSGKAVGGRVGWLPLANSSVEIGLSGQYAKVGDKESEYEDVAAGMLAFDFSTIQKINPLSSNLDIKVQYNYVKVDKADYINSSNETYTFNNKTSAWFAQAALRPAYVDNKFFKNIEFAVRISSENTPKNSMWAMDQNQTALGINYWFDWNSVIKFDFQTTKDKLSGEREDGYFIQWAFGL